MNSIAQFRPILAALCFLAAAATVLAQGSAFTYQGKLTDGGSAPTGAYDFRFILYNADAGGSQVGTTLTADDVVVTAGAFTVVLDFGANIFDGQARWLELAVRQGASTGIYTVLSPRQPVTPAPYAIFAAKAGSVANGGITAAQLAPGAVTATAIASGAITADKISDGAISTNKLSPSVLAGLGGTPSGAVLMSQDPNATNLTAAGYVRFGSEVLPNETESLRHTGAFSPRSQASVVWTGSDLLIWGGYLGSGTHLYSDGYRFSIATNQFTGIATGNAPDGRSFHSAIWTGAEMVIWGGCTNASSFSRSFASSGGRYHLASGSWLPTSNVNAPEARVNHTAIWTGTEMIVWGGYAYVAPNYATFNMLNTGGRYNPVSNTWTPLSTTGAPAGRNAHFAVWTGTRMLVWGGILDSGQDDTTGGLYNPATDTWTAMSTVNAPRGLAAQYSVWTGSELFAFEQNSVVVKRYSPANDTWQTLTTAPSTSAGFSPKVWTGSSLLVFDVQLGDGFSFAALTLDSATLQWSQRVNSKPSANYFTNTRTAFWMGDSALLVDTGMILPLARYRPQSPLYLYVKP